MRVDHISNLGNIEAGLLLIYCSLGVTFFFSGGLRILEMGKGFKLRFSLIHSLQFCRSRNRSALPESPVPASHRLSTVNRKGLDIAFPSVPDPPPSTPWHPFRRRRVKTVPMGCGCRRGSGVRSETSYDCDTESVEYSWKKDGKWHVISRVYEDGPRRKICYSPFPGESDGDLSPNQPQKMAKEKKVRKKKKKGTVPSVRTSTSSGDSGWFSSEGGDYDEETETLLSSSRSFSNDSSFEFNHPLETISEESKSVVGKRDRMNNSKKARRLKRHISKNCRTGSSSSSSSGSGNPKTTSSPEAESPARVSVYQGRIPCRLDGKVRESFAVVKKSKDPYEDFKKSMVEMIMEKQMFETEDLEQLLQCFLSLNSPQHHGIIVEAFSVVWEGLFCKSPPMPRRVSRCL